jgi:hypothetical protein
LASDETICATCPLQNRPELMAQAVEETRVDMKPAYPEHNDLTTFARIFFAQN